MFTCALEQERKKANAGIFFTKRKEPSTFENERLATLRRSLETKKRPEKEWTTNLKIAFWQVFPVTIFFFPTTILFSVSREGKILEPETNCPQNNKWVLNQESSTLQKPTVGTWIRLRNCYKQKRKQRNNAIHDGSMIHAREPPSPTRKHTREMKQKHPVCV
jgi:hypothetical protein